jgi:hypothetical protein
MGVYFLNNRKYKVTQDDDKIYFHEVSERKNKVHFSFSKDPKKHETAKEGMEIFWTELYS